MRRFAFDFVGNFLEPSAQGGQITIALLFAGLIAAQIEDELRIILTLQFCLNGALQFGHHGLELVYFFFSYFFEILFQILCAFETPCFERCQQGLVLVIPQCLKMRLDGGWRGRIGGGGERRLGFSDVETAEAALDQGASCSDDLFM